MATTVTDDGVWEALRGWGWWMTHGVGHQDVAPDDRFSRRRSLIPPQERAAYETLPRIRGECARGWLADRRAGLPRRGPAAQGHAIAREAGAAIGHVAPRMVPRGTPPLAAPRVAALRPHRAGRPHPDRARAAGTDREGPLRATPRLRPVAKSDPTPGGGESRDAWQPALVEIEEALVPAFIIEELEDGRFTVFVPSVPTPFAGAVYVLSRDRVHPLDVAFTQAVQAVSRWGSGTKDLVAAMKPEPPCQRHRGNWLGKEMISLSCAG